MMMCVEEQSKPPEYVVKVDIDWRYFCRLLVLQPLKQARKWF